MRLFRRLVCLMVCTIPFRAQCRTIAEALTDEGSFSVLLQALDAAGLVTALSGPEVEVTVFAPTDAAFGTLLEALGVSAEQLLANKDLADILRVHVAVGQILSGTVASGAVVQSLEGARLSSHMNSTTNTVVIGGADVVKADLSAGKSVIHAIDKVLLPPQRRSLDGGSAGWSESSWSVTVDGVMGGKSTGNLAVESGTMVFTGNINLDGGGFSSVNRGLRMDLSSYAGLLVEFDSHIYKENTAPLGIHLQLGSSSSTWDYSAPFAMPFSESSQERCKIFVPMEAFDYASRWGRTCSSCKLDPSKVDELSVYVLFQSGPFEVRLHSIQAVDKAMDAPLPTAHVVPMETSDIPNLIRATIRSGASLYDKGYRGLCLAIYATTMRQILAANGPSMPLKDIACAGLRMTMEGSNEKKAWALRKALDALTADASGYQRTSDSRYPSYVQGSWLPEPGKSGPPGVCAGLADLSSSGQNSTEVTAHDASESTTEVDTTPSVADNKVEKFLGPFEGWGISGWNDLQVYTVSHPSKCGELCLQDNRCKSFDYGARGRVTGECWLSTADRTIAGAAYSEWTLYDYYERDTTSAPLPTTTSKPASSDKTTVEEAPCTSPDGASGEEQEREMYESASVNAPESCKKELQSRTCNNGIWSAWSGTFTKGACQIQARCVNPDAASGSLQERDMYEDKSVNAPATCKNESQSRTCTDGGWGPWSGSHIHSACQVQARCSNPDVVNGGSQSRERYQTETVDANASCLKEPQTRKCINGDWGMWSGTYTYTECQTKARCENPDAANGSVQSRDMYEFESVNAPASCNKESQSRTCTDGGWDPWSGSHIHSACQVQARCSNPDVVNGGSQSRERYQDATVDANASCLKEPQTRKCTDGTWGMWSGTYTYTECQTKVSGQVKTATSEPLAAGTKTIKVQDVTGLSAGMDLVISDGTNSETKLIVSVALGRRLLSKPRRLMAGTVTVDTPLRYSFAAGADVTATGKANPAPSPNPSPANADSSSGEDSDDDEKTLTYILIGGGIAFGLLVGICASCVYLRVKSKRLEAAKSGNMPNNTVVGQPGGDFVIGQPVQGSAGGKGGDKVEK